MASAARVGRLFKLTLALWVTLTGLGQSSVVSQGAFSWWPRWIQPPVPNLFLFCSNCFSRLVPRETKARVLIEIGEYPAVVKESGSNPRPLGVVEWYPRSHCARVCVTLAHVSTTPVEIISTWADLVFIILWVLFTHAWSDFNLHGLSYGQSTACSFMFTSFKGSLRFFFKYFTYPMLERTLYAVNFCVNDNFDRPGTLVWSRALNWFSDLKWIQKLLPFWLAGIWCR